VLEDEGTDTCGSTMRKATVCLAVLGLTDMPGLADVLGVATELWADVSAGAVPILVSVEGMSVKGNWEIVQSSL
jgi:hypothetical protein